MEEAETVVRERTLEALAAVGMSDAGLDYVRTLKGYPKTPYYMTLWVRSAAVRREVGVGICMHSIGVKLLDDLIDGDQALDSKDQVFGVFLIQKASTVLCSHDRPVEVLRVMEADFCKIWRQEVRERRVPPQTLAEWNAGARVKSGLFLGDYAAVACLAGGAAGSVAAARDFAEAFGTLYMMGDDWMDYEEMGESEGNLAHLLATGKADPDSFTELVRFWQRAGKESVTRGGETCCDPRPFFDHFAEKILGLYLQASRRA